MPRGAPPLARATLSNVLQGLYVLTDTAHSRGRTTQEVVQAAVRGGAAVVQLREKQLAGAALRDLASRLRDICRAGDCTFIVNDDPRLAAEVGADGVHLGPDDAPPEEARQLLGPSAEVGWSAKGSLDMAAQAQARGASYIAAGSMFPTQTKVGATVVGPDVIRAMREVTSLPIAAIGGITLENVAAVVAAGADMICTASGVVGAANVEEACRQFVGEIEKARGRRR
ncbi:MAG: thiamine phosphate synthase [Chloroflexota bacterium]